MVNVYTPLNQLEPKQAMMVNGQYLEEVISGYRTLSVEGREALDLDIETIAINTRDGGTYKRRRINSRVITVNFSLVDSTPEGFAEKFNKIKQYLYGIEEAQLIFDDEPDMFFTGSFRKVTASYIGLTSTGKIEILCADPFKYSLTEYTVSAENGEISVTYGGTYPAHPILTAQSADHDCGFYAFTDRDGHLIQVGNPTEEDQEEVPTEEAQKMIDTTFGSSHTWDIWSAGNAQMLYGYYTDGYAAQSANDYIYSQPTSIHAPRYYYGPAYGTLLSAPVPNFEASFTHWFEPSDNQSGGFDFYINNQGGGNICGVCIYHNKSGRIQVSMIVKGTVVKQVSFSLADNPFKGVWRTQTITKSLGTVTFNVGGVTYSVTDPDLAGHAYDAYNVSFVMYRQPSADSIGANNALKSILFYGTENEWRDIANKIPQNGLIEVDAGSGEISLNGASRPDLGSINNDFEDFKLETGINTVTCNASDWVDDAVYTMKYREVYL